MTYLYRANAIKTRSRLKVIGVAFVVLLALLLFGFTNMGDYASRVIYSFVPLILKAEGATAEKITGSLSFASRGELLKENEALHLELKEAEAKLVNYNIISKENADLKKILGRVDRQKLLLGAVLAKPNRSPYDTLLVDVGSQNGVKKDMLVLAYGEAPIGVVSEVRTKSSLIRLFSSPGETHTVVIGEKQISASAFGVGGGNFRILLPKDAEVSLGDTVSLPGEKPRILGTVEKIEQSDTDTFARILFKSSTALFELRHVFVVTEE